MNTNNNNVLNITDDIAFDDKIKYLIDVFMNKLYFIDSTSKILSIQFSLREVNRSIMVFFLTIIIYTIN